jgi:ABC-type sulfate transport system permease component
MLSALIGPATQLLDKFVEDKDKKNEIAHELATMAERHAQELAKGQLEANAAQAKHPSLFVAGARPAIMWICAAAMAYHFILQPFILFGVLVAGIALPAELPELDMGQLMPVLLGILGLGGMRSYEKVKGIARENLKQ